MPVAAENVERKVSAEDSVGASGGSGGAGVSEVSDKKCKYVEKQFRVLARGTRVLQDKECFFALEAA